MNKKIRTYIAGPMTGIPDYNYPAFFRMEKHLTDVGFINTFNPAKNPKNPETTEWKDFMIDAIAELIHCKQAVFLSGWRNSRGALREKSICDDLEIPCFDEALNPLPSGSDPFEGGVSVCEVADMLVSGDRQKQYGTPKQNFQLTADLVSAAGFKFQDREVKPEDVACFFILAKLARQIFRHKLDNLVDICGFAKCWQKVAQEDH